MTDTDSEDGRDASAETGDPAAAFDALRQTVEMLHRAIEAQSAHLNAEMTIIRKGVEAAFDQLEDIQKPVDYSADLGSIMQSLGGIAKRLQGIEASPALRHGPEENARVLADSGETLVRSAVQKFESSARELDRSARDLAGQVRSARVRETQNSYLGIAAGAGILVGILLLLFLPRVLPFGADTRLAAVIVGKDRWLAGSELMAAGDPPSWRALVADWQLTRNNADVIARCRQEARETGKEQQCVIVVPADE